MPRSNFFNHPSSKAKLTLIVCACLTVVTLAAKGRPSSSAPSQPTTDAAAAAATVVAQQNLSPDEELQAEIITLRPAGFDPAEIARPQGHFFLGVDNRSGLREIELWLDREKGGRVPALQARKRKLSWRDVVDLPPGRYVLGVVGHPDWRCVITITPH